MAINLNKKRMRDTRILVALVLVAAFLTAPVIAEGTWLNDFLKLAGFICLTACAIGRIYSTAFIGGVKNEKLMTVGAYSMCRNPLYFYSLVGAAGIGLMSGQIISLIIVFGGFLFIYDGLIKREEEFLTEKFGQDFTDFKARVPRLLPDPKKYNCPDELLFQPKYLNYAIRDAIWWFAPVPVFSLITHLHSAGILHPLFRMF
jgi:protein-S-isoprenylcysteine O-methyltransferase Ste14